MNPGTELAAGSEAEIFYNDLVKHRLIIPAGVLGAFGRGAEFERVLEAFNALVLRISAGDGAEVCTFPPVIDRRILERVDYMDTFPDLCGAVYSFFGKDREARALSACIHAGKPWDDALKMTQVTLNPAACYPLYPTMTGMQPAGGRLVTMLNWVFRHEPSPEATMRAVFPKVVCTPSSLKMVAAGFGMIAVAGVGFLYFWHGSLFEKRWLLWRLALSVLGPQIANEAGWFAAEIGRQPWIVYGLLRTPAGLSAVVKADAVLTAIILFSLVYLLLFAGFLYLLNDKIQHGPDAADLTPSGKLSQSAG